MYSFGANNNPFNLMFAHQSGATLGAGGFAAFPDVQSGSDAAINQLSINQSRGILTPSDLYAHWAEAANPSSPLYNPAVPQNFNGLLQQNGVDPNTPLDLSDPTQSSGMLSAMFQQETGSAPSGSNLAGIQAAAGGRGDLGLFGPEPDTNAVPGNPDVLGGGLDANGFPEWQGAQEPGLGGPLSNPFSPDPSQVPPIPGMEPPGTPTSITPELGGPLSGIGTMIERGLIILLAIGIIVVGLWMFGSHGQSGALASIASAIKLRGKV